MTKIEITIQERKGKPTVTWIEQSGDELPQELLDNINVAIANAMDKADEL